MTILDETARLVKDKLASEYEAITIERVVIGVFLAGLNYPMASAGLAIPRSRMFPGRCAVRALPEGFLIP